MLSYYDRLWNNKQGIYTVDYEEEKEDSFIKYLLYKLQEESGLSTF